MRKGRPPWRRRRRRRRHGGCGCAAWCRSRLPPPMHRRGRRRQDPPPAGACRRGQWRTGCGTCNMQWCSVGAWRFSSALSWESPCCLVAGSLAAAAAASLSCGRLQFLRDTVGQVEGDSMQGTLLAAEVRGTCRLGGFNALALSNICFQCHRGAMAKKKKWIETRNVTDLYWSPFAREANTLAGQKISKKTGHQIRDFSSCCMVEPVLVFD